MISIKYHVYHKQIVFQRYFRHDISFLGNMYSKVHVTSLHPLKLNINANV